MFGFFQSFDYREGSPHVDVLVDFISAQDWKAVVDFYRSLTPSERHHTIRCASHFVKRDAFKGLADFQDVELLIVLGGLNATWASFARGFGYAEDTSYGQWTSARDFALRSLDALEKAISLNPDDTTIHGFYIQASMYAPSILAEGEAFDEEKHDDVNFDAVARCVDLMKKAQGPINIFAARSLVSFDSPKWYGSFAQMEETVEELYDYLPKSNACSIEAFSLFESWLWYVMFEEDKKVRRNYIQNLDSIAHIKRMRGLSRSFWDGCKDGDLKNIDMICGYNEFANLFCCYGFYGMARKHLKAMGENVFQSPWAGDDVDLIYRDINLNRLQSYLLPLKF